MVVLAWPLPVLTYQPDLCGSSSVLATERVAVSEQTWGSVTDSQGLIIFTLFTVEGWRGRTAVAAFVATSTMSRYQQRQTPMTGDLPRSCPLPLSAARPPTPRSVLVGASSHLTAGSHHVLGSSSVKAYNIKSCSYFAKFICES